MAFGHKDEHVVEGTHKPSIGEKIGGAVDSIIGKATHKPEKVAEGETKKTGNPYHGEVAGREEALRNEERREERREDTSYRSDNENINTAYIPAERQNVAGLNNSGVVEHDRTNLAYGQPGYDNDRHEKPSAGDKISGGVQSLVGKATHNPEKVAEGEVKKTHDPLHAREEASEVRRDNIDRERDDHHERREHSGVHDRVTTGTIPSGYVGETAHQPHGAYGQSNTGAYDNSVGGNHGGAYGQTGGAYDQHDNNKPGIGEKLSGGMSSTIGKATHNPEKVAEGEYKKTHDPTHAQQEAREVRHDNIEREGGAYGQNQTGGAYGVGGNQQTGTYGNVNPTGGAYDNTNTGNRY